jgi:hypothetical protein
MSTKHTPGLWTADGRTGSVWKGAAPVDRKNGLRVAVVDISEDRESEDQANAKLIAAAPELAEALETLLSWEEARGLESDTCSSLHLPSNAYVDWNKVRAALKKAGRR